MIVPDSQPADPDSTSGPCAGPGRRRLVWAAIVLGLVAWVVWRIELFPLASAAPLDGVGSMPRAYFTVDHPFHTARAELLRSAWSSLNSVRWIGSHQGGYPAEFYPLGAQAIAAALAIASLGHLAMASAWSITIVLIFLLPGVAYLLIGRIDRVTPAVAVIALAGQVAIASDWTHGGYTELVEWGLATNVAGFTWALVALPLLAGAVGGRSPRLLGLATLAIAMCAVTNPRALLAVAVIGVAVLLDGVLRRDLRAPVVGSVAAAVVSVGLAAPVLVPLVRYRDLYFFLSYQDYPDLGAWWSATVDAVTWPVLVLAGFGAALAVIRGGRAARVAALTLALYMLMTALMVLSSALRDLIPQLELPRLMPFQRLLVIWLAAFGVVEAARLVARVPASWSFVRDVTVAGAASVALLVVFTTSAGPLPAAEQGLRGVPRVEGQDALELRRFEDAIVTADERAADGAAILVIGSRLSWHEQLWAPMVAPERRFYYNDWLWYWHRLHVGPYDYRQGHFYPNPSDSLTRGYLAEHGIGAVVITDIADRSSGLDARQSASASRDLAHVETIGAWDVYTVRNPVGLATLEGKAPGSLDIYDDGETFQMRFDDAEPGVVKVRQNWFPRWQATVNGTSAPVGRGEDGYMEVDVPAGDVELRLHYGVTAADVAARIAAATSALLVLALLVGARPSRRWARR